MLNQQNFKQWLNSLGIEGGEIDPKTEKLFEGFEKENELTVICELIKTHTKPFKI